MMTDPLTVDPAALDDDALLAYITELTGIIDAAPVARPARVRAFIAARDRVPPIPIRVLAAAGGGMTTSGVINSCRMLRQREHEAGAHPTGGVSECRECEQEASK